MWFNWGASRVNILKSLMSFLFFPSYSLISRMSRAFGNVLNRPQVHSTDENTHTKNQEKYCLSSIKKYFVCDRPYQPLTFRYETYG